MSSDQELLKSLTIGVLYGGPSAEREVSIESGENCARALAAAGYRVQRVLVDGMFNAPAARALRIDLAFLALHGEFGEDGTIQGILEEAVIAYTGSGVQASALAFDKTPAKQAFEKHGVRTPPWLCIDVVEWRKNPKIDDLNHAPLPFVVKPASGGSSLGVSIVRNDTQIVAAINQAAQYSGRVLIEQYISGRELTVGVLGDAALPPAELKVAGEFYDYNAKYSDDRTRIICPAKFPAETAKRVRALGLAAHHTLGCRDVSRTDIMLDAGGTPWVLEVNTLPGMTSHSLLPRAAQAVGKTFTMLCEELLRLAFKRSVHCIERRAQSSAHAGRRSA